MKGSKKLKLAVIAVASLTLIIAGIVFCYNSKTIGLKKQNAESIAVKADSEIGSVRVKYLDTEGNSIARADTFFGNVGEFYTTTRKEITSYKAFGDEPLNKKGYYEAGETVVEYVYEKSFNDSSVSIGENNEITVSVENERAMKEYELLVNTVCSQGNQRLTGAGIDVYKDSNKIFTGKSKDGNLYVGTITVRDESESIYSIKDNKSIDGYVCNVESQFDLKVIKSWNDVKKEFEISLDYNHSAVGVESVELNAQNQIIVTLNYRDLLGNYTMNIVTQDSKTQEPVRGAKFTIKSLSSSYIKDVTINNDVENIDNFELTKETAQVEYYAIEQVEAAEGYDSILKEPIIIEVKKVYNREKNRYEVEVNYDESLIYVEVIVEEDGTITIIVSCARSQDNNQDLGIELFLNKVDNQDITDREPVINYKDDNTKNEITGKTDNVSVENNNELNLVARVYNNSDSEINGGTVKISIPEGLKFNPENLVNINNEWEMYIEDEYGVLQKTDDQEKANTLISNKLLKEKIAAYNFEAENKMSYLDLNVVLTVCENKLTNSREIKIPAKLVNLQNDLYEENNENYEYLYVKYFDLEITKYLEKVDIFVGDKKSTREIGFDKKDSLTKLEVKAKTINATKLKILYGIKVENVGEIPGLALEIADFIPEGLEYNSADNTNWYLDGDVLKTTELNSVWLNPGESKTIYLSLDWQLNENHIGERVNQAKITNYYNASNSVDLTEDNISDSRILVAISTGAIIYTGIIIGILIIITSGVVILKKSGRKE